jgi:hypothetical protein
MDPITVNLNIVWDETVNDGRGYTEEEKKKVRETYIAQAKKNFGNVDINFNITETTGKATNLGKYDTEKIEKPMAGAINVFFTKKDVDARFGGSTEVTHAGTGQIFISTGRGANERDLTHGIIHAFGIATGLNGYSKLSAEVATEYVAHYLSSGKKQAYQDNRPPSEHYGYASAKIGSPPTKYDTRNGFDVIRDGARKYLKK